MRSQGYPCGGAHSIGFVREDCRLGSVAAVAVDSRRSHQRRTAEILDMDKLCPAAVRPRHSKWLIPLLLIGTGTAPLTVASSAAAGDWAQFRGPGGLGASGERNLPVKWSSTENIAWKAE